LQWCRGGVGKGNEERQEDGEAGEVHFGVCSCADGSGRDMWWIIVVEDCTIVLLLVKTYLLYLTDFQASFSRYFAEYRYGRDLGLIGIVLEPYQLIRMTEVQTSSDGPGDQS
jgi:hypothetical protein